jgi:hypothetical protein
LANNLEKITFRDIPQVNKASSDSSSDDEEE